jgi:hypothetical protein
MEMAAAVEAVPTMTTMTTMTAMTTTGRCEVWGERCGTDGNGTGKGDESFSQHGCVSSSEHRPHGVCKRLAFCGAPQQLTLRIGHFQYMLRVTRSIAWPAVSTIR